MHPRTTEIWNMNYRGAIERLKTSLRLSDETAETRRASAASRLLLVIAILFALLPAAGDASAQEPSASDIDRPPQNPHPRGGEIRADGPSSSGRRHDRHGGRDARLRLTQPRGRSRNGGAGLRRP